MSTYPNFAPQASPFARPGQQQAYNPTQVNQTQHKPFVMAGGLDFYSEGGGDFFPNGQYCMYFNHRIHQLHKKDGSPASEPFLAAVATAYSLTDASAAPIIFPYSLGKKAEETLRPNPDDDGKTLVAVPGTEPEMNNKSNWFQFHKSLVMCGMPKDAFLGDLRAIDGVYVLIHNVNEPDRQDMRTKSTGDVAVSAAKRDKKIPVVAEIYPQGMPWMGTGGVPQAGQAAPRPAFAAPQPQAYAPQAPAPQPFQPQPFQGQQTAQGQLGLGRPNGLPQPPASVGLPSLPARPMAAPMAPQPQAPVTPQGSIEEVGAAAVDCLGDILSQPAFAAKISRTNLQLQMYEVARNKYSEPVAKAIYDSFFPNDGALASLVGAVNYRILNPDTQQAQVVPA